MLDCIRITKLEYLLVDFVGTNSGQSMWRPWNLLQSPLFAELHRSPSTRLNRYHLIIGAVQNLQTSLSVKELRAETSVKKIRIINLPK